MTTIRDRIQNWAAENISNASVITRNTDVYNHLQEAVGKLLAEPWASIEIKADMPPANTLSDTPKVS